MENKYILKAVPKNIKEIEMISPDNKKYIRESFNIISFDLYENGKLIKRTTMDETNKIINVLKNTKAIQINKENDYTITDQKFINENIKKPINRKSLIGIGSISSVGLVLLMGIYMSKTPKEEDIHVEINTNQTYELIKDPMELTSDKYYEENSLISYNDHFETSICTFNFEDRSNEPHVNNVINRYGNIINKYCNTYGLDYNLVVAIICQENPNNIINTELIGGHGPMQVESIWNNVSITCYNFDEGCYETILVDINQVNYDVDYAIQVGCMILANTAENINSRTDLNDSEALQATIIAYNKGITITNSVLNNTNNFDEFIDVITSTQGGDNFYREHVLSYLPDNTIVHMNCVGRNYYITIDNENVNTYTRTI